MKTLVRASLFALALLAAGNAPKAQAWGLPGNVECGFNAHCSYNCGGPGCFPKAMPWYLYFPYNAHFQTPAPMGGWPYWPAAVPAAYPSMPNSQSNYEAPRTIQPVAYYGPSPSYWYGR